MFQSIKHICPRCGATFYSEEADADYEDTEGLLCEDCVCELFSQILLDNDLTSEEKRDIIDILREGE